MKQYNTDGHDLTLTIGRTGPPRPLSAVSEMSSETHSPSHLSPSYGGKKTMFTTITSTNTSTNNSTNNSATHASWRDDHQLHDTLPLTLTRAPLRTHTDEFLSLGHGVVMTYRVVEGRGSSDENRTHEEVGGC